MLSENSFSEISLFHFCRLHLLHKILIVLQVQVFHMQTGNWGYICLLYVNISILFLLYVIISILFYGVLSFLNLNLNRACLTSQQQSYSYGASVIYSDGLSNQSEPLEDGYVRLGFVGFRCCDWWFQRRHSIKKLVSMVLQHMPLIQPVLMFSSHFGMMFSVAGHVMVMLMTQILNECRFNGLGPKAVYTKFSCRSRGLNGLVMQLFNQQGCCN